MDANRWVRPLVFFKPGVLNSLQHMLNTFVLFSEL